MVRVAKIMVVLGLLVLCGPAWAVEVNEPVSHWKFDETSGTTAYDSAGDNNGTFIGEPNWTAGQVGGALEFDGVDDYVDVGDPADGSLDFGTGNFSISAWVKQSDLGTFGGVFSKTSVTNGLGYGLLIEDENRFCFRTGIAGWDKTAVTSNTSISTDTWYHVVGVREDTTLKIYVNGSLDNSTTGTLRDVDNTVSAVIGRFYGDFDGHYHNGIIDDVRIYDRALSPEEIQQLYYEGFSDYERAIIRIENAIDKKRAALETVDAALVEEGDAYDALEELLESGDYGDLNKRDIVKAKQKTHSAIRNEERSLDALEKSIEKLYDALSALGWEPEPEPNLISHWKFDETSGTIAYDSAGGNDGTIYGAVWTAGQIDGALSFDGLDDYVDVGTGPAITGTGNFTVSAWVKVRELPASGGLLAVVNQRSTSSANGSYIIDVRSSGYVHFEVYNGGYGFYFDSDVNVGDGFWHHIVGVRTSTTEGEIYVDGSLAGSGSGPAKSLNSVDVVIGRWNGAFRYFNGSIDDVRIYDRALSAEEIQELYLDGLSGSGKGKGKGKK